jgi:hypothetical protein
MIILMYLEIVSLLICLPINDLCWLDYVLLLEI